MFKPALFIFLRRGKCILLTLPVLVTIIKYVSSSKLETVIIAVTFSLGPRLIMFAIGVPLEVLDWSADISKTLNENTLPLSVKNNSVSCVSATWI